MSSEDIERLRESIYRNRLDLPGSEGVLILDKLLTDERMRAVWNSLSRRITSSKDYLQFWSACSGAIIAWRGEQKLTAKQRREFYVQMYDHAAALQGLVQRSREFHLYSITKLIDEPSVEWLVDTLDIEVFQDPEQNNGYTRFCLHDVIPSIYSILEDITLRALKYSDEEPLVLKPGSENAHVHYFVRSVSKYLQEKYGQPLHEVVAVTASVAFKDVEIDADLVRKLVKVP